MEDVFTMGEAVRAMPHMLGAIDGEDETTAELEMIVGFDDDLAGGATRVENRLHGLLTQIPPSLERVLGRPRLHHPAVLNLLERFGSPAQIRKAGRRPPVTLLRPRAPRMAERLVEEDIAATRRSPGANTTPRPCSASPDDDLSRPGRTQGPWNATAKQSYLAVRGPDTPAGWISAHTGVHTAAQG